jgi:hypothetical protein
MSDKEIEMPNPSLEKRVEILEFELVRLRDRVERESKL